MAKGVSGHKEGGAQIDWAARGQILGTPDKTHTENEIGQTHIMDKMNIGMSGGGHIGRYLIEPGKG